MIAAMLAQAMIPDLHAMKIYRNAVAAMHAIAAPAYLRYEADVTTTISGAGAIRQLVAHVERTTPFDDALHLIREDRNNTSRNAYAKAFVVPPDLFLGHGLQTSVASSSETLVSGLDDTNEKPLKTIAVVSAPLVHYDASIVFTESLPTCPGAIHLNLMPREAPLTYNLRELWVDAATSKICRAVAVYNGRVNHSKVLASITLDLDSNGFIDHFATSVTGRSFLTGSTTARQEGTFRSLETVDASAWSIANEARS